MQQDMVWLIISIIYTELTYYRHYVSENVSYAAKKAKTLSQERIFSQLFFRQMSHHNINNNGINVSRNSQPTRSDAQWRKENLEAAKKL